jgi:hypothetical protein
MKKYSFGVLLISSMLALAACGSDTTSISDEEKEPKTEEVKNEENKKAADTEKEAVKDENVQEDDQMKATNTFTNKELNITGTVGPMNYSISGVQLKKLEPKTQEIADLFEVEIGDTVHAITIEMSGENTSDEDMSFYLGQATIITNTKEQLEPDMFLSENIEGDYLGKVKQAGHNVYILKNSTVDDLKSIEIRVSAPMNTNFDSLGEDVKQVIQVNN